MGNSYKHKRDSYTQADLENHSNQYNQTYNKYREHSSRYRGSRTKTALDNPSNHQNRNNDAYDYNRNLLFITPRHGHVKKWHDVIQDRRSTMSWKKIVMFMGGLYIMVLVGIYLTQEKLIFIAASVNTKNTFIPAGIKLRWIERPDGAKFRLLVGQPSKKYSKPQAILLFFGSNGETMPISVRRCVEFSQYGMLVMAPESPGYGETPGPITKEIIEMQAEAVAKHARDVANTIGIEVFAVGSSLGCFSAILLATEDLVTKIVLHAPPTSLIDVASDIYWYIPIKYLLNSKYHLNNRENIKKIRTRIRTNKYGARLPEFLIIHGDKDNIVLQKNGKELCDIIKPLCKFINAKGYGHDDVPLDRDEQFGEIINEFFKPRGIRSSVPWQTKGKSKNTVKMHL